MTLHTDDDTRIERALESLNGGIEIGGEFTARESVVLDRIS